MSVGPMMHWLSNVSSADLEGAPNYYPNSFSGPTDHPKFLEHKFTLSGDVARYNSEDDDNFTQVKTFWQKVVFKYIVP